MKKLFLTLAILFIAASANAQLTWNVKAGIGSSFLFGDVDNGSGLSWKVSAGFEKPLSPKWLIMPSLELKQKSASIAYSFTAGMDFSESEYSYNLLYIQVPIHIAYRFNVSDEMNMALKFGPYFGYALNGEGKSNVENYGSTSNEFVESEWDIFKDGFDGYMGKGKRFALGVSLGVDFEYHQFVFGVEAECDATDLGDGYRTAGVLGVIGYKF